MANILQFPAPNRGSSMMSASEQREPVWIQSAIVTLGGSGDTTAFTFTALGLANMHTTTYHVQCTPLGATTEPIRCTTRTATGFTLTHETDSGIDVSVMVWGTAAMTV